MFDVKRVALLLLLFASVARAESDFHAYLTSENLGEMGRVEKLTVVYGKYLYILRPPIKWYRRTEDPAHKVIFTSASGRSAITVLFTANSPGTLPSKNSLKTQALLEHPGASLVQSGVPPMGEQSMFFDLVRMTAPGVVQRARHVFVAGPAGEIEFILASTDDEFETGKLTLTALLRPFRIQSAPAN